MGFEPLADVKSPFDIEPTASLSMIFTFGPPASEIYTDKKSFTIVLLTDGLLHLDVIYRFRYRGLFFGRVVLADSRPHFFVVELSDRHAVLAPARRVRFVQ